MKASEVFDLPVSVNHPFTSEVKIGTDAVGGDICIEFHDSRQAWVAARCINHADALADALEALLPNIDTHRELAVHAVKALAAYRGEK